MTRFYHVLGFKKRHSGFQNHGHPRHPRQQHSFVGIVAVWVNGAVLKMEATKARTLPSSVPIRVCPTSDGCFSSEPADAHQRKIAGCQAPISPAMMPSCTSLSVNSTFSGATVLITGLSRHPTGIPLPSTASVKRPLNLYYPIFHQKCSYRCDGIRGEHCAGATAPSMPNGQPHIPHGAVEEGRDRSGLSVLFPIHSLQNYTCGCEEFTRPPQFVRKSLEKKLVLVQDHSAWNTYCTRSPSSMSFRRMGGYPRPF